MLYPLLYPTLSLIFNFILGLMATTRVVLRKNKVNPEGKAPLYLRITHNRKSSFVSLNLRVPIKQWDETQDRIKPKSPNAQELNSWILQKQNELEQQWLKAQRTNAKLQVSDLKDEILGRAKIDFFEIAREDYEEFKAKGKINTWRRSVSIHFEIPGICSDAEPAL
jgi:hypothetical protein